MATITLKNIPADLHRELKKRAEEHHRSLNKEIIATLRTAAGGTIRPDPTKLEESVRQPRALFRISGGSHFIGRILARLSFEFGFPGRAGSPLHAFYPQFKR